MTATPGTVQITLGLSPHSRAVKYAESLGVATLPTAAKKYIDELEPHLKRRSIVEQEIRNLVQLQGDREVDLIQEIEIDGKLSVAALERELKSRKHTDENYSKLQEQLLHFRDEGSYLDAEIKALENRIRTAHTEMMMIASHLDFLAAEKQNQTLNRMLGSL